MILKTRSIHWNVAELKSVDVADIKVAVVEGLRMENTDKCAFVRVCARII